MNRKLRLNMAGVVRLVVGYLLLLGMWFFFRSYLLFLMLAVIPCLVLLSCISLQVSRDKLWAEVVMPFNRVGKNTDFTFDICLHNDVKVTGFATDVAYEYGNVFTGFREHESKRLWLAPARGCTIRQQLRSAYAGRVEGKITRFTVYDLFHVVSLSPGEEALGAVLVWPSFEEVEEQEICSRVEGFPREAEIRKRGAEYNPDYEVREYIPGDELKSIHWKLSAKKDQLMVRERLASGREKVNVLLPLEANRLQNDALLEALYSLGRLLLEKGYPMQLYWPRKGVLQGCYILEAGELEHAISRVLSSEPGANSAQLLMENEHPGEKYILIQTGAYNGIYIQ